MVIRELRRWPSYFPRVARIREEPVFSGPLRVLSLDEQMEVRRAMYRATFALGHGRRPNAFARELAAHYGVTVRTIYRYAADPPSPGRGLERAIAGWIRDRDISLTDDDVRTLLAVIARWTA